MDEKTEIIPYPSSHRQENSSIAEKVNTQVESAIGPNLLVGVSLHPQIKPFSWNRLIEVELRQGKVWNEKFFAVQNKPEFDGGNRENYHEGDIVLIEYEGIQHASGLTSQKDYLGRLKEETNDKPGKIVIAGQIESVVWDERHNQGMIGAREYKLNLSRGVVVMSDGLIVDVASLLDEKNKNLTRLSGFTPLGIPLRTIRGIKLWSPQPEELPYLEQTLYARLKQLAKGHKGLKIVPSNVDLEKIIETDNLSAAEQRLEADLMGGIEAEYGLKQKKIQEQIAALQKELSNIPDEIRETRENAEFQLNIIRALKNKGLGSEKVEVKTNNKPITLLTRIGFSIRNINPLFFPYVKKVAEAYLTAEIAGQKNVSTWEDLTEQDKKLIEQQMSCLELSSEALVDLFTKITYGEKITVPEAIFFDNFDQVILSLPKNQRKIFAKKVYRAFTQSTHPDRASDSSMSARENLFKAGSEFLQSKVHDTYS